VLRKDLVSKLSSILALAVLIIIVPEVEGHQLFNSEEEKIGGYRIAVATDPEIPGPGNPSRLMVQITDYDNNDLIDVRAGLKIFKDDILIHELTPRIHSIGHIDLPYTFPASGLYIVEVGITTPAGKEILSKFNVGIIQTFGYIFFAMILVGAFTPAVIVGGIYYYKRKNAKQVQS
jgi:hypothetical protein